MIVRPLTGFVLSVLAVGIVLAQHASPAWSAAAIMVDQRSGKYGYCKGAADAFSAMTCAEDQCRRAGGQMCEAIEGCPVEGFGAIAVDRRGGTVSGTCGLASAEQARAQALSRCAARGGNAESCQIVANFQDGGTAVAPEVKPRAPQPVKQVAPTAPAAPRQQPEPAAGPEPKPAQPPQQAARPAPEKAAPPPAESGPRPVAPSPPAKAAEPEAPAAPAEAKEPKAPSETAVVKPIDIEKAKPKEAPEQSIEEAERERQQAMADKLVGRWSNKNCAERFWEISKIKGNRYRAMFWYYETGVTSEKEFTVKFVDNVMELHWDTKNPNKEATVDYYIEKVRDIRDKSYIVFQNNYRNYNEPWEVRRC